jgi:hypothetical protein
LRLRVIALSIWCFGTRFLVLLCFGLVGNHPHNLDTAEEVSVRDKICGHGKASMAVARSLPVKNSILQRIGQGKPAIAGVEAVGYT